MTLYRITISNDYYSPERIEIVLSEQTLREDTSGLDSLLSIEHDGFLGKEFVSWVEPCKIIKNCFDAEEDEEMNCIINNLK